MNNMDANVSQIIQHHRAEVIILLQNATTPGWMSRLLTMIAQEIIASLLLEIRINSQRFIHFTEPFQFSLAIAYRLLGL